MHSRKKARKHQHTTVRPMSPPPSDLDLRVNSFNYSLTGITPEEILGKRFFKNSNYQPSEDTTIPRSCLRHPISNGTRRTTHPPSGKPTQHLRNLRSFRTSEATTTTRTTATKNNKNGCLASNTDNGNKTNTETATTDQILLDLDHHQEETTYSKTEHLAEPRHPATCHHSKKEQQHLTKTFSEISSLHNNKTTGTTSTTTPT